MALISWEKVCKIRKYGGIGLRKIRDFSMALWGKLAWQVSCNKDKIWIKIYKEEYLQEAPNFLNVNPMKRK